jgi:[ribosomal protein S18]-alanine N-acetyltransferase
MNEPSCTVRTAAVGDLSAVCRIDAVCFGTGHSFPYTIFRQWFDLAPDFFIVAECAGETAGYIAGAITSDRQSLWILSIAVLPEFRHHNVAFSLMREFQRRGKECGVVCALCTTHPDNIAVLKLCDHFDFEIVGQDPQYFGPGEPRVLLRRKIKHSGSICSPEAAAGEIEPV